MTSLNNSLPRTIDRFQTRFDAFKGKRSCDRQILIQGRGKFCLWTTATICLSLCYFDGTFGFLLWCYAAVPRQNEGFHAWKRISKRPPSPFYWQIQSQLFVRTIDQLLRFVFLQFRFYSNRALLEGFTSHLVLVLKEIFWFTIG